MERLEYIIDTERRKTNRTRMKRLGKDLKF